MASPIQWTWVWASSRKWWRTGKPGVLQFMGLQQVGHDWDWTTSITSLLCALYHDEELNLTECFPGGSKGKESACNQETQVRSLGWEDPLEKEMATHSSILAWRIPWTEKPGRLQFTGSRRVGHDWVTSCSLLLHPLKRTFIFSNM